VERRARADLRVGPPEVEGGHGDPQAIAREVRDRRKAVAACYERALKQQPNLAGKLVIRFTIAPAGTVPSVEVDEDTLGAPAVAACVRAVILRWRFTAPGEEPVEVSFPFVFQAGDAQ
jgi:TonB family protein